MKITTLFMALAMIMGTAFASLAEVKNYYIAFHVDQNDPAVMNLTLNNAQNVRSYYEEKGDTVTIEIVTYGPGLKMLTADSPVKERIATMSLESDKIQFTACGNTHQKMVEKAGKDVPLLSEAVMMPSGVVRLVELQENGYSYVKP